MHNHRNKEILPWALKNKKLLQNAVFVDNVKDLHHENEVSNVFKLVLKAHSEGVTQTSDFF